MLAEGRAWEGPVDVDGGGNNDRAVGDVSERLQSGSTFSGEKFSQFGIVAGQRLGNRQISRKFIRIPGVSGA